MRRFVYADNAATTKMDDVAFEAMRPFLVEEFGNPSQPYSMSRKPKKAIKEAREIIASCIGASPDEIYFTSGGSESDNWAIKGAALLNDKKSVTITSAFEHHAVLHSCEAIERQGYPVVYMRPSKEGYITPDILRRNITDKPYIVSVMFANNELGSVQPIKELSKIAHSSGALFHTDAVQVVGHLPINVVDLDVDMLSSSGHKFNGPKGVGFLYIKKGIKMPSYIDGGAQESNHRAGTENVAGIVGMAAALQNNYQAMKENIQHLRNLEKMLVEQLDRMGISYVRNGGNNVLPGLISLSFPNADGEAIMHRMDLYGISVSTGSACDSKNTEISHVLQAIGLDEEYAKGTIRISLGKNNTQDDVVAICTALGKILSKN